MPTCLRYPPFEFLEKLPHYPTYDERYLMLERGLDFNAFEENNIQPLTNSFAFQNVLIKVLNEPGYMRIKEVFMKVMGML